MPRKTQHYNLLFIFTDQQRTDTMGAYGNRLIETPNLDKLSRQSTVFDKAYVSQPVCTPSRSTLMTGLWPHTSGCIQNNIPLPQEVRCFPEMLESGVYETGYVGKWHLGDEIFSQHGFTEWKSIEDDYRKYYRPGRDAAAKSSYWHFLTEKGVQPAKGEFFGRAQTARLPEEIGKPAFVAQESCRFIQQHRHSPFVLCVNFLEPHSPFFGPRDNQYPIDRVPLPGNYYSPPTMNQPLKTRVFHRAYRINGHSGLPLKTESDWKRMIANYWGLCSLVDTAVGRILDTLSACGLDDKTIVVFTSDHGDMMASHQLIAKCVMFEEAVRVPLMIRLPGQTQYRRIHGPVSHIDLVPTLLEAMGQTIPSFVQGKSLLPYLTASYADPQNPVFIEWNGSNSGIAPDVLGEPQVDPALCASLAPVEKVRQAICDPVRSVVSQGRYKFNCSAAGENELYDLAEDPGETCNLYQEPVYKPLVHKLFDKIRRWQEQTNDSIKVRIDND